MSDSLRLNISNYETDEAVFFYTPHFYVFDNFSSFAIEIWGKVFATAEHAYQWKKFDYSKSEVAEQILLARSARDTKVISDANRNVVDGSWDTVKIHFMEEILRAKLTQHEVVKKRLIETTGKDIVENSPTDGFWGCADGGGENHLGKLWMKLRSELLAVQ
jgi:ribA/ribD-fused uncharacterized protein